MKRYMIALLSALAVTMTVGGMTAFSQEKSRATKSDATANESSKTQSGTTDSTKPGSGSKAAAKSVAAKTVAAKPKPASASRRLPTGFSSLSLSDEQKEEIFRIRGEHAQQIEDLQEQIQKLRMQLDKDLNSVLTTSQRKMLASQKAAREEAAREVSTKVAPAESVEETPVEKPKRKTSAKSDADDAAQTTPTKSAAKKKV